MLMDIKARLSEPEVQEMLAYAVFPEPSAVDKAVQRYTADPELSLYGYEEEGVLIGILGFSLDEAGRAVVTHLAVHPEYRGQGYGRGQILELIAQKHPVTVTAETDEDAVDFYRSIGFSIVSLGEKYPGVERFQCTYEVAAEED